LTIEDQNDESDNELSVSALWTEEFLHLAVEVRDGTVETPESSPRWNRDGIEIGWEPAESGLTTRSDRVRKWIVAADGSLRFGRTLDGSWEQPPAPDEMRHSTRTTDEGYRIELSVPWDESDISPADRDEIKICLRNNDRDDGDVERLGCLSEADAFDNPSTWDTLMLTDPSVRGGDACERDAGSPADTSEDDGGRPDTGVDADYEDYDRRGETTTVSSVAELESAVESASPGDVIEMEPGTYAGDVSIDGASGRTNHPIAITGTGSKPADYPVVDGGDEMGDSGSCMVLEDVSWVTVERLRFENCWDKAIVLRNAQYVTVDTVEFLSAAYAVFTDDTETHHTLLQNSHWKPAGREFWADIGWGTIKNDEGSPYHALAQSSVLDGEGRGANVIRRNELSHTFNAYRNRYGSKTLNVELYENYIHHVRDNAIEPETHLFNFHIYYNRMDQIDPGMISVDSDSGGQMYMYGNVGWYDHGDPSARYDRTGVAGHVFKLVSQDTYLDRPMYVFHNSFANYRTAFKPTKVQRNIKHYNNAYATNQGMHLGGWGDWLGRGNEFDYDAAASGWDDELEEYGHEENGLEGVDPQFRAPANNDFRLEDGSQLIDAGAPLDDLVREYDGDAPDIGAFEGDERVKGPTFRIRKPSDGLTYREHPRVTHHEVTGSELTVYYSWPLEATSIGAENIALFDGGRGIGISDVAIGGDGRRVTVSAIQPLTDGDLDLCFDSLPEGTNGQKVTYWAATLGCR